jgi:hypothetical protein
LRKSFVSMDLREVCKQLLGERDILGVQQMLVAMEVGLDEEECCLKQFDVIIE